MGPFGPESDFKTILRCSRALLDRGPCRGILHRSVDLSKESSYTRLMIKNTTTKQRIKEINSLLKSLKEEKYQLQVITKSDRVKCHGDYCSGQGAYAKVISEFIGVTDDKIHLHTRYLCKKHVELLSKNAQSFVEYQERVKEGETFCTRCGEDNKKCHHSREEHFLQYLKLAETVKLGGPRKTWFVGLNGDVTEQKN